jgi:hypothetical protein
LYFSELNDKYVTNLLFFHLCFVAVIDDDDDDDDDDNNNNLTVTITITVMNIKHFVIPVIIGATGIATKRLKTYLL